MTEPHDRPDNGQDGELDCCGGSYDHEGEMHYTDCRATKSPGCSSDELDKYIAEKMHDPQFAVAFAVAESRPIEAQQNDVRDEQVAAIARAVREAAEPPMTVEEWAEALYDCGIRSLASQQSADGAYSSVEPSTGES